MSVVSHEDVEPEPVAVNISTSSLSDTRNIWLTFLLLRACLDNVSMCCGWMGQLKSASTGFFQQQGGNSIYKEAVRESQWRIRAKNTACQAWRNAAAREVEG